jgi:hypothetical protein
VRVRTEASRSVLSRTDGEAFCASGTQLQVIELPASLLEVPAAAQATALWGCFSSNIGVPKIQ